MRNTTFFALCLVLALVACQADEPKPGEATMVSSPEPMQVEVGCASCIYKMDGITSCQLAAKVDGKPILVKGLKDDAHSLGLCGATKEAQLVGHVEGDHFAATQINLDAKGGG